MITTTIDPQQQKSFTRLHRASCLTVLTCMREIAHQITFDLSTLKLRGNVRIRTDRLHMQSPMKVLEKQGHCQFFCFCRTLITFGAKIKHGT